MIIRKDTIWKSGQVINIADTVQIAPGATLTIEAGVTVRGGNLQVYGTLDVRGAQGRPIKFDNLELTFGSNYSAPGRVDMKFTTWEGGAFLPATGNASYGSFSVSDSVFQNTQGFYIWYPTGPSGFSRSLFQDTSVVSIGTDADGPVVLSGNAFVNLSGTPYDGYGSAIEIWASYGAPVQVEYNTFSVPDGGIAIELPKGYTSAEAVANNNYWGTTNQSVIRSLILDARDDLERASNIPTGAPLSAPHPSAPVIPLMIRGSSGGDSLGGGRQNDTLRGFAGDDRLNGEAGNDWLDGGTGIDQLRGGAGDDTYVIDNIGDRVFEGKGQGVDAVRSKLSFQLSGNVENLVLTGSAAIDGTGNALNNTLTGNAWANLLTGGAGNDVLNGGRGRDSIVGGKGADQLSGGLDAVRDVFIFKAVSDSTPGAGRDRILDFRAGVDDIDLHDIDANMRSAGNQTFDFSGKTAAAHSVWYVKTGANLIVRADVNGDRVADLEIAVLGQNALSAGDFLL